MMLVDGVDTPVSNPLPDTVTILEIGASPPKIVLHESNENSNIIRFRSAGQYFVSVGNGNSFGVIPSAGGYFEF